MLPVVAVGGGWWWCAALCWIGWLGCGFDDDSVGNVVAWLVFSWWFWCDVVVDDCWFGLLFGLLLDSDLLFACWLFVCYLDVSLLFGAGLLAWCCVLRLFYLIGLFGCWFEFAGFWDLLVVVILVVVLCVWVLSLAFACWLF